MTNLVRLATALDSSTDYLLGQQSRSDGIGLAAAELVLHFGKMSAEDQDSFLKFAKMLANKPKTMRGCTK